jgi:peptidyl-prolyl cis-trans isomerase C
LAALLVTVLSFYGCAEKKDSKVLVRIGNVKITVGDFKERLDNLPANYKQVVQKKKKEFLQEVIKDSLLYGEALRLGLDKDKDVQKVIEEARKKILIAKLLQDKIDAAVDVTDEEIKAYYENNKAGFTSPEVIRVSQILVEDKARADEIIAELKNGGSFEGLAKARSLDPTAENGGDIGYFTMGQLLPEFENACVGLSVGGVAGPIRTKLGYHVIKLTDRKKTVIRPLDEVKDSISEMLRAQERREKFNRLLKDLEQKTRVEIDEKALQSVNQDEK